MTTKMTDRSMKWLSSTVHAAAAQSVELCFGVSRDQEHTELAAVAAGALIPLGARTHNFPLLCLAKQRLVERKAGVQERECGWVYSQDFRELLGLHREALNLQLWRATQAMKKVGLPAELLIERRLDSQQLRIGFEALRLYEA
jgi:hypothetical protein